MDYWRQHAPERRLLLTLLGSCEEALDKDGMASLFREVNWQNFVAHTSPSLHPYLAFQLESYAEYIEARGELELLFRARRLTAARNLRLRHELGRVIEALRQAGIPALALKGIVLAYTAYPDSSLRPMSDLDLLVPPGAREKAIQVLQKLGFEYPERVKISNRDHFPRLAPEEEFAPGLALHSSKILVEVHSQLECSKPVFPTPIQEFWSRSVAVDLHGLKTRTLSPEDFLFHLCLHQARRHRFENGFLPLVDVRFLIDFCRDWRWSEIASRSIRSGCAAWMYLTLRAARDLSGAAVADGFFDAFPQSGELKKLSSLVEDQIFCTSLIAGVPIFLPSLLAEPSWRTRTQVFLRRMRLVAREEGEARLTLSGFIWRRQLSFRRLLATLKIKIPYYFRAWKAGRLRLNAVKEASRRVRKANTLFQMITEQEASWQRTKINLEGRGSDTPADVVHDVNPS